MIIRRNEDALHALSVIRDVVKFFLFDGTTPEQQTQIISHMESLYNVSTSGLGFSCQFRTFPATQETCISIIIRPAHKAN